MPSKNNKFVTVSKFFLSSFCSKLGGAPFIQTGVQNWRKIFNVSWDYKFFFFCLLWFLAPTEWSDTKMLSLAVVVWEEIGVTIFGLWNSRHQIFYKNTCFLEKNTYMMEKTYFLCELWGNVDPLPTGYSQQ